MSRLHARSATIYIGRICCVLALWSLFGCSSESSDQQLGTNGPGVRKSALRTPDLFPTENEKFVDFYPRPPKPPEKPVTMENGIKYQDLEQGFGLSPSNDHMVIVHCTGYLPNGTKFESSRDNGIPFIFTVGRGQAIAGIEQGIMGMKVGGKRKLTIPPSLGYGSKGRGKVPPNATVTFEVELLSSDQ